MSDFNEDAVELLAEVIQARLEPIKKDLHALIEQALRQAVLKLFAPSTTHAVAGVMKTGADQNHQVLSP
jgi:hypothetical protein